MNAHKKVMFVDDEESVRLSWDRYLSAHGFEVTTAEDGGKAISKMRNEEVDVVVSDLKMPGVDGIQLLEWIHSKRPETQFILLTGYGSEDVERTVRQLGAFDYLNKPISPDTLAAVVTAATHLNLLPKEEAPVAARADTAVMESERAEEETVVEAQAVQQEVVRNRGPRRTVAILGGLIVAPILGLAFVVFLPVIGFAALFWTLGESLWDRFKPVEV